MKLPILWARSYLSLLGSSLASLFVSLPQIYWSLIWPTIWRKNDVIKNVVKHLSESLFKGALGYTENQHVSYDFKNDTYSSNFDVEASIAVSDHFVKLMSWYDDELNYKTGCCIL